PYNEVSGTVVKTGAGGIGYDVGTSFAAPKVAHIVAQLAKKFPEDSTLLYKALVVQSARLPEHVFFNPTADALRSLGYGLPEAARALGNTPYRITFVAEGTVAAQQANLYMVSIPQELSRAGTDYDILIEVTLTYTANCRRTRRLLKSYLGSWLTWESSRLDETFDAFSTRVLKDLEEDDDEEAADEKRSIRWTVSTSPTYGHVADYKRQDSAVQKDWAILKSNQLPKELSFAVVGHKGWDKDTAQQLPFALAISFEAISRDVELYQMIEVANEVEVAEAIVIPINGRL
ncbi:MAG: S8 family serine peptidase, partial [Mucilaginibacter sp.]